MLPGLFSRLQALAILGREEKGCRRWCRVEGSASSIKPIHHSPHRTTMSVASMVRGSSLTASSVTPHKSLWNLAPATFTL